MKMNYLINKGYRYYIRLSGAGIPVLGSMIARRYPPRRSNGTWTDITSCLTGCCTVSLNVITNPLSISKTTADVTVYDIKSLAGVSSSNGDVITNNAITQVVNGITVALTTSGSLTLTAPSATTTSFPITIVFTDTSGNSKTVTVNVSVITP